MINPSSRYRIELPDICEQAKRSPSISLFSIPFMRERSNSASRGPGANPLIFRRIERSPSTSRPSACNVHKIYFVYLYAHFVQA